MILKVATILFTYNRSRHTEKVLNGIKNSIVLPEKLYVFQDGLKSSKHKEEWDKVNTVIKKIDFCPVELVVADENKGLARSIVDGINYAFKEHEAVIVLEDDCVPTSNFMSFMNQCFEKYKDNQNVYSVGGYGWPIETFEIEYDVYFTGRISSWGWGTWKNRWKEYTMDNDIIDRIYHSKEKSIQLALWGKDLESMFYARLAGKNDSWAVYWALHVIEKNGICVAPVKSLIDNIGMDGSGVHCGESNKYNVRLDEGKKTMFHLPDVPEKEDKISRLFTHIFASDIATEKFKESIIIYGSGGFFRRYEKKIMETYNIKGFCDTHKTGYFAGLKIVKPGEIKKLEYDKILIMIKDANIVERIVESLISNYDIPSDKIVIGYERFERSSSDKIKNVEGK